MENKKSVPPPEKSKLVIYTKELNGICKFLVKKHPENLYAEETRLKVDPKELEELMRRRNYEHPYVKLREWRRLGFILTNKDKKRNTLSMREGKGYKRYVVFNYTAITTALEMLKTEALI